MRLNGRVAGQRKSASVRLESFTSLLSGCALGISAASRPRLPSSQMVLLSFKLSLSLTHLKRLKPELSPNDY